MAVQGPNRGGVPWPIPVQCCFVEGWANVTLTFPQTALAPSYSVRSSNVSWSIWSCTCLCLEWAVKNSGTVPGTVSFMKTNELTATKHWENSEKKKHEQRRNAVKKKSIRPGGGGDGRNQTFPTVQSGANQSPKTNWRMRRESQKSRKRGWAEIAWKRSKTKTASRNWKA